MEYLQFTAARADTGAVLPLATATVYLAGTATKPALFNKVGGSIGNPVTANSSGLVSFAAVDGVYDVQVSSADASYTAPLIESLQLTDTDALRLHKRPEASAVSRVVADERNDRTHIRAWAGDGASVGQYAFDATAALRAMVAETPNGSTLDLSHGRELGGTFRVTDTITIDRHISIRGKGSLVVGDFTCAIVASISGTTITITSLSPNAGISTTPLLGVGSEIVAAGVLANTYITGYGTGTGGLGTYIVSISQTVTSRAMVAGDIGRDMIRYAGSSELRGVFIEGVDMYANSGVRDTIRIGNHLIGHLGFDFRDCNVSAGSGGWAVNLVGVGAHFNVLNESCTISGKRFYEDPVSKVPLRGAVRLNCADGNVIKALVTGEGCGILVDLVTGSYRTKITGGIISRDVGVFVRRGQKVDISGAQIEQPGAANRATYKGHIVMAGAPYAVSVFTGSITGNVLTVTAVASGSIPVGGSVYDPTNPTISAHIQIEKFGTASGATGTYILTDSVPSPISSRTLSTVNEPVQAVNVGVGIPTNLGGGTNLDTKIILVSDVENVWIGPCDYNALGPSGKDIQILSASVVSTRIDDPRSLGGVRGGVTPRGSVNTLSPRDLLLVGDSGTATMGYAARKLKAALSLTSSWDASTDFAVWVDPVSQSLLHTGVFWHGTNTGGTAVGTLPIGMRPLVKTIWSGVNDVIGGTAAVIQTRMIVDTTGVITVGAAEAAGVGTLTDGKTSSLMNPLVVKSVPSYLSTPF